MPRRTEKGRDKLTAREADTLARAAAELERVLNDRTAIANVRFAVRERRAA